MHQLAAPTLMLRLLVQLALDLTGQLIHLRC